MNKSFQTRSHPIAQLSSILLIAIFTILCLFTTILSIRAFSSIQQQLASASDARLVEGYLRSKVRGNDSAGTISVRHMDNTDCLVLQNNNLFDVIYFRDRKLTEQLWDGTEAFEADLGEVIASLNDFSFRLEKHSISFSYTDEYGKQHDTRCPIMSGEVLP